MPTRPPVLDGGRPTGVGLHPPTAPPPPRIELRDHPSHGPQTPRRGVFIAFVAFLAGALIVGAAFGAYALGERNNGAESSSGATDGVGAVDIRLILDRARPSVVTVTTGAPESIFGGAGSGVVLEADGLILTNAHVVASNGGTIDVRFHDGRSSPATIVGSSVAEDLALLQVDRNGLIPATLGSSADLRVGDDVIAIGNALALGDEPSVTKGIVSAKNRAISEGDISLTNLIQTDAAINPGNSGGPLVNAEGEVVGINTAIIADAQSVGFAISIDRVRALLPELSSGEGDIDPDGAVLGVATVDVDATLSEALADAYGVVADSGALITQMDPDSAAAESGLQLGDVITEIDGEAMSTAAEVSNDIRSRTRGDQVRITVDRAGQRRSFDVTLGPR